MSLFCVFCLLSHFLPVRARPGFFSVSQSPVAMWTVAGANGGPGPSARSLVEEELSPGDVSVITRPLRAVGEAAWEPLNSRETATYTCAQVLSSCPTENLSF